MSTAFISGTPLELVFLVPRASAFILYRLLPAAGEGGKTLYGVPVKLTGSIAGYVIVLPIGVDDVSLDDVSVVGHYSVYSIAVLRSHLLDRRKVEFPGFVTTAGRPRGRDS